MFPLCLKHPAAIFILIFYLFQHTFSEANSTLTIQPPSVEYDPSDPLWLENSAGYGGSDFYDFPKKPPYGYGGVAALHHSRWLVPVLGYSMIAHDDRVRFQVIPVITWLTVVLETTANMWFHDQLVRDWMDRQGAKVMGDPVFMAEVADNDTSATGPASGSVSGTSGQQRSMDVTTSPVTSISGLNPESRKRHKKGEDKVIHLCGSKSCPACNHGPCHCPDCSPPKKMQMATTPETTSVVRSAAPLSRAENMVFLLRQREYTGQWQTREKLEFTIKACNPEDEAEISGVIPLKNGNLLSWTAKGNLKIWSVQGEPCLSDEIPVELDDMILKVFVIDNDHIVVWTGRLHVVERLLRENLPKGQLQEWKKVAGVWQSSNIAPDISVVEQLPNRQLVTYSETRKTLGIWVAGEQCPVFTEIRKERRCSDTVIGVSETRFITYCVDYSATGSIFSLSFFTRQAPVHHDEYEQEGQLFEFTVTGRR